MEPSKPILLIISGPTATGKTQISLELAKRYKAPIVNFDSLLFYKELNIGTAKPTLNERQGIPHYLIDVANISSPLNAADYVVMARPLLDKLFQQHPLVLLVGGSGFYLRALVKGMYDSPTTPDNIKKKVEKTYEEKGIAPFLQVLKEHDIESFNKLHENDHYRIMRAVEHFWAHGTPFSQAKRELEERQKSEQKLKPWKELHYYLDIPKAEHLKIIEKRTGMMLQNGLIEEVKSLLAQGFSGEEKPLQSIGYKEVLDYLSGIIPTIEECQERIIISTRQLAKAQRTWFKKIQGKQSLNPLDEKEKLFCQIKTLIN